MTLLQQLLETIQIGRKHKYDVTVRTGSGKEVKVHKGIKADSAKHAENIVKYKHPEGYKFTVFQVD